MYFTYILPVPFSLLPVPFSLLPVLFPYFLYHSPHFLSCRWFADELSNAIIHSQILIRGYAATHLKETFGYPQYQAEELAHSCVSQRDIQVENRVLYHMHTHVTACVLVC